MTKGEVDVTIEELSRAGNPDVLEELGKHCHVDYQRSCDCDSWTLIRLDVDHDRVCECDDPRHALYCDACGAPVSVVLKRKETRVP